MRSCRLDVQFEIRSDWRLPMSYYASINESIRLGVTTKVSAEIKSALATFCRRNGFAYLFPEDS